MNRFETQYPVNARFAEIEQILHFVKHGKSCQLIAVPGGGRSTIVRLLAYNQALRIHHLKEREAEFLFVYVNFAEVSSFTPEELNKFMFINLLFSLEQKEQVGQEVGEIFQEALVAKDAMLLFQNFKKSLEVLSKHNITPIFLFDRFSEYAGKTDDMFFMNLRSLRTASGNKVSIVFSNHRPLEQLLPVDRWKNFYEFFVGNHIFVSLKDPIATNTRISLLEKEYEKTLDTAVREGLYEVTGGHAKLMKLTAQYILEGPLFAPQPTEKLINYLLQSTLIKGSLLEIWQSLTSEERKALKEGKAIELLANLCLPFPLFSEFIQRDIPHQLIPRELRLNEEENQIYFGDDPLDDLTKYEFRLLTFFIKNPYQVLNREDIILVVWSDERNQAGVSDEALDQMIYRLRKKIEDEPDNPRHIATVKGRGFRFIP